MIPKAPHSYPTLYSRASACPAESAAVTAGHEARPSRRRPAILAVDDEPAVLVAVSRDLRRGFGERFRVLAASGTEALEVLRELRTRGEQVAMLIADQRMPGMPGIDLVQARTVFPDAKRVLLTAYADTEAAIAAINEVALDYYLLKPWDLRRSSSFRSSRICSRRGRRGRRWNPAACVWWATSWGAPPAALHWPRPRAASEDGVSRPSARAVCASRPAPPECASRARRGSTTTMSPRARSSG